MPALVNSTGQPGSHHVTLAVHSSTNPRRPPGLALLQGRLAVAHDNRAMFAKFLTFSAALLLSATALAQPAQSATQSDNAQCVAALKLQSDDLASQVKAGDEARKPELLQVLRQGAAFVGDAWLDGTRNEDQAKAKLDHAEDQVRKMEPAKARALRQQCGTEADTMIREAPGWQRKVIDRFAQSRMDKLLQSPQ